MIFRNGRKKTEKCAPQARLPCEKPRRRPAGIRRNTEYDDEIYLQYHLSLIHIYTLGALPQDPCRWLYWIRIDLRWSRKSIRTAHRIAPKEMCIRDRATPSSSVMAVRFMRRFHSCSSVQYRAKRSYSPAAEGREYDRFALYCTELQLSLIHI